MNRHLQRFCLLLFALAGLSGKTAFANQDPEYGDYQDSEYGDYQDPEYGDYQDPGYGNDDSYASGGYGGNYQDPAYGDYGAPYASEGYGHNYGRASCDSVYCGICRGRQPIDHFMNASHVGALLHTPRWGDVFYSQRMLSRINVDFAGASGLYFCGNHSHPYTFGSNAYGYGCPGGGGYGSSRYGALSLGTFYQLGHSMLHGSNRGRWGHGRWNWSGYSFGGSRHGSRDYRSGGTYRQPHVRGRQPRDDVRPWSGSNRGGHVQARPRAHDSRAGRPRGDHRQRSGNQGGQVRSRSGDDRQRSGNQGGHGRRRN